MDMRKHDGLNFFGIEAELPHVRKQNIAIAACVKQNGLIQALNQARKSPGDLQPFPVGHVIEHDVEPQCMTCPLRLFRSWIGLCHKHHPY
jgi:hypothetical protein